MRVGENTGKGSEKMKDLFLFTIGPVKEFIESSRKLMDLYAGSSLLSELMREAVCWLERMENVKILFPCVNGDHKNEPANIPNRIVAEFTDYSQELKYETAGNLTDFVKCEFSRILLKLLDTAEIGRQGIELAQRQWEDFLEIYWTYEEYDSSSYTETYQRMIAAIHEVKQIRTFSQTTEPWGRKCMLFPKYNAIFAKRSEHNGKNTYPYHINPVYVCDITENHFLKYVVKPREALSSIALAKRIYGKIATDLYSTRYMLLARRVPDTLFNEAGIKNLENEQRDMLANAVYDLANGRTLDENEYPGEIIQRADCLYGLINQNGVKLSSYYAIIKFDGDNMGDAFKDLHTVDEQQELSRKISSFAYEVPVIIRKYGGLPVFAGGEDFLGFIPLDDLFECVSILREQFVHTIKRSFSVGISIAHLMQPLKEVMACVDTMEASAKSLPGKNAFSISIMKRGGTNVRMPAYKLVQEKTVPQWKNIEELVQILNASQCSKSMFYNIVQTLRCFSKERVKPADNLAEILLGDCVNHAELNDKQIDRRKLVETLMLFYKNSADIEDFLNTLDGIVFLSREVNG